LIIINFLDALHTIRYFIELNTTMLVQQRFYVELYFRKEIQPKNCQKIQRLSKNRKTKIQFRWRPLVLSGRTY